MYGSPVFMSVVGEVGGVGRARPTGLLYMVRWCGCGRACSGECCVPTNGAPHSSNMGEEERVLSSAYRLCCGSKMSAYLLFGEVHYILIGHLQCGGGGECGTCKCSVLGCPSPSL